MTEDVIVRQGDDPTAHEGEGPAGKSLRPQSH